jgi:hypothetical protein
VQAGAGHRPVVSEHPQLGAVEAHAYRADPQIQPVPIVKPEHASCLTLSRVRLQYRVGDCAGRRTLPLRWATSSPFTTSCSPGASTLATRWGPA